MSMGRKRSPATTSNSDLAYSLIRERISSGTLSPGDVVSENALAREFGMSRTPVREAVLRMVREGMLVTLPKRGTMVATLGLADIEETYNIRELLEGLAARLAATRATEEDLARAGRILEEMAACTKRGDVDGFFRLDGQFHAILAEIGQSRRLATMLGPMRDIDFLDYIGRAKYQHPSRLRQSLNEHVLVFEAIRDRNAAEAERRMREHVRSAARFLAESAFGIEPSRSAAA
jgi:DNA-binding GntR family transcriptional regulator